MNLEAKAPKGRGVVWMRRIANVGFAISALYFIYLLAIIVVSWRTNSEFQGQSLGDVAVELFGDGSKKVTSEQDLSKVSLVTLGGHRKQAIVLWATWCGPCHSLLEDLKAEVAAGRLAKESVIAVSMVEPLKDVEAYLAEYPPPFRVALDRQGNLAKRVKLQGTPTVMFLNEAGVIEKITTGGFSLAEKIAVFAK